MLASNTFRANQRLQNCAVENPAHVKLNSSGPHVALIQRALCALDHALIDQAEIKAQLYGPTTAAAVLDYKTRRQIINKQYQTTPDNIVGVMTIKSLDTEMIALELRGDVNQMRQTGRIF
jgi:hypothetical protein